MKDNKAQKAELLRRLMRALEGVQLSEIIDREKFNAALDQLEGRAPKTFGKRREGLSRSEINHPGLSE